MSSHALPSFPATLRRVYMCGSTPPPSPSPLPPPFSKLLPPLPPAPPLPPPSSSPSPPLLLPPPARPNYRSLPESRRRRPINGTAVTECLRSSFRKCMSDSLYLALDPRRSRELALSSRRANNGGSILVARTFARHHNGLVERARSRLQSVVRN